LAEELTRRGYRNQILDGDEMRKTLCADLGFTDADRLENIRRITYVAGLLAQHGIIVLVAAISPLRAMREAARRAATQFCEVFVDAPLSTCEARDVRGLYKQARAGHVANFTGIDSPYEAPLSPEVICRTDLETVEQSAAKVLNRVLEQLSSFGEDNSTQNFKPPANAVATAIS
jgi:adenylyl-sulfate kinase